MKNWLYSISLLCFSVSSIALENEKGALIFYERCVLCHGNAGMGEGILPLKLKDYPKTSLLSSENLTFEDILKTIKLGGPLSDTAKLMPPMQNELNDQELQHVAEFVVSLRKNNAAASAHIKKLASTAPPSRRTGEHIYNTRCVLCHGNTGKGDGRMARVIKNPAPADLTATKTDLAYIKKIVELGGEPMGRSSAMPPWGDQFSDSEIESIGLYILHLRKKKQ